MPQSSTLYDGLAGQKESMAVAYAAHEHEAAVTYLGPSGTRQCDLSRAREEALSDLKTAQCRRNAFLRHTGRVTGGAAHLRWLGAVVCPTPAPPIVFHEYVRAVTDPTERLQRLA